MKCRSHDIFTARLDFYVLTFYSTLLEDTGIQSRTVATLALAFRRSNNSARAHLLVINPPLIPPPLNSFYTVHYNVQYCHAIERATGLKNVSELIKEHL